MGEELLLVVRWWGTLFLVGAVAFPLTKRLFSSWHDQGYFFAKAVGMAVLTWLVYVFGTLRILPFTWLTILISLALIFSIGLVISRIDERKSFFLIACEELFFFGALLLWSWVKGHEASIHGLEKFMDFGFMKSILESQYFPPADMWYAPLPINYYYFGHMVVAVLTKTSGIDLSYSFNLMLATIFALTVTMSFSIGYQLRKRILAGALTAFLVTLAGNMQTIYAFTRGYTGENVKPFWELFWPIGQFVQKLPEGLNTYWYANATRFIPFTIHEFPSYSFVVSDVHGHVLSLPFALLAIGMIIAMLGAKDSHNFQFSIFPSASLRAGNFQSIFHPSSWRIKFQILFYGFLVGVLLMTNASDGPIYFALLGTTLVVQSSKFKVQSWEYWKEKGTIMLLVAIIAGITSLPFLSHFKSFVSGVAVNCPPSFLANSKVGPIIFEGVEKCQHSPLWMMILLWGFFLYCGVWLLLKKKITQHEKLLLVFFGFSVLLIIFPEFFYFKDIYPAHFRSNTMFKLGYQAFILFSIVSGYFIVHALITKKKLFLILLVPQLLLVSIYPIFSVRSYFNSLREYKTLDGLEWFRVQYPDDYSAIQWLNNETRDKRQVLVEADGDSYTDYARFSAFTGMPTIIGWPVHEWLWRGSYDVVAPRREEVRLIYESEDLALTKSLLSKYNARFIVVGTLERQKYANIAQWKLQALGRLVFNSGSTELYEFALSE